MNVAELKSTSMVELNDLAVTLNIGEHRNFARQELIFRILQAEALQKRPDVRPKAFWKIMPDGFGFFALSHEQLSQRSRRISMSLLRR